MKDLVNMFFKSDAKVVDLYSNTFATAMVCLELTRHRRIVGCKVDADCFVVSTETLVEMFARQVLNEKSYIFSTYEVVEACTMVLRELDGYEQGSG